MHAHIVSLSPQEADLVRKLPLFEQLAEQDFTFLLAAATVRAVEKGSDLFVQGDPADRFFVVLEGWAKLYRINLDGAEAVVRMVNRGESFAEAAMFAGGYFPVSAQAVTDLRALSIPSKAFADCVQSDVKMAFAMLGSLSLRLRMLVQQVEQLQVQSAPQRVGSFLLSLRTATARLCLTPQTHGPRGLQASPQSGAQRHGGIGDATAGVGHGAQLRVVLCIGPGTRRPGSKHLRSS